MPSLRCVALADDFRDVRWLKRQGARLTCTLDRFPVFGLLPAPCPVSWGALPLTGRPVTAAATDTVRAHGLVLHVYNVPLSGRRRCSARRAGDPQASPAYDAVHSPNNTWAIRAADCHQAAAVMHSRPAPGTAC